jgi:hypothetical protein
MTPTMLAISFTLISVTHGGQINHADGFTSLHVCEQARSLALTGQTLEQVEEAAKARESARRKETEAWRAAHPLRPPTAQERTQFAKHHIIEPPGRDWFGRINDQGLVEEQPLLVASTSWVATMAPAQGDTRWAQCVIEPAEASR